MNLLRRKDRLPVKNMNEKISAGSKYTDPNRPLDRTKEDRYIRRRLALRTDCTDYYKYSMIKLH